MLPKKLCQVNKPPEDGNVPLRFQEITDVQCITDPWSYCPLYGQQDLQPQKTLIGVCIAIMYYGLFWMKEAFLIRVEDVRIVGEEDFRKIQVNFDHQQKRKKEGFTHYIPSIYLPLFQKYMTELQTMNVKTKYFFQSWNVKGRKRIQKSGENIVKNLHKNACNILHISAENYTTQCWRLSAATNLADRGVSFINLKQ